MFMFKNCRGITFQHPFVYVHTRVYTYIDISIRLIIIWPVCFNCGGAGGGGTGMLISP